MAWLKPWMTALPVSRPRSWSDGIDRTADPVDLTHLIDQRDIGIVLRRHVLAVIVGQRGRAHISARRLLGGRDHLIGITDMVDQLGLRSPRRWSSGRAPVAPARRRRERLRLAAISVTSCSVRSLARLSIISRAGPV